MVAAKRAEAEELRLKKEGEERAAAAAALGGAAKGYAQRKAAKAQKDKEGEKAKHIQATFRGRKERKDPSAEVNVRRERNKNDPVVQARPALCKGRPAAAAWQRAPGRVA